jgi:tetratricopeptide (TPR) repeat protein
MRGLAALWCALSSLAFTAAAAADSADVAKTHYTEALKRYNLGEYANALDEFKTAYLATPDPAFLFNIAQCQRQLGLFDDAAKSYQAFLRESPEVPQETA